MNKLHIYCNLEIGHLGYAMVIIDDCTPYFTTDCVDMLGYPDPNQAKKAYCGHIIRRKILFPGSKVIKSRTFVSLDDLIRLIDHSPHPKAKAYRRWILNEVILCAMMDDEKARPLVRNALPIWAAQIRGGKYFNAI